MGQEQSSHRGAQKTRMAKRKRSRSVHGEQRTSPWSSGIGHRRTASASPSRSGLRRRPAYARRSPQRAPLLSQALALTAGATMARAGEMSSRIHTLVLAPIGWFANPELAPEELPPEERGIPLVVS